MTMYTLYAIDTTLRITAALLVLFVAVPALAWRRPASLSRMEWFWWNLGVGIALLTFAGQLFTLLNIASTPTYLVLFAAIIVLGRARAAGQPPLRWIAEWYRNAVLFTLRVLDGRSDLRSRFSTFLRDGLQRTRTALAEHRGVVAAFSVVGVAAVITRFYRAFATANLGFSDTYAHLYLMRLLDEGKQVDPAWGPYPRGMHFLMLAIQRLTNVDAILMMNFFGAFAGVLIVIAVADTARRVTRSNIAALVAGLIFATMIGDAGQYFTLGGSVASRSAEEARELLSRSYADLATAGEFDVLLTAFQRQTSTLPQELAIVLLLPAALFLLDWLRTRDRWRLAGFTGCTAAIAAVHSGVLVPLIALCAAVAIAVLLTRLSVVSSQLSETDRPGATAPTTDNRQPTTLIAAIARAVTAGAIGVLLGSSWLLGFIRYGRTEAESNAGGAALYYFPFLRAMAGEGDETAYMMLTPFLIAIAIVAAILAIAAIRAQEPHTLAMSLGTIFFIATHSASVLGIPEIIETRRNATWLAMMVAVLLGIAVTAIAVRVPRRFTVAVPAIAVLLWCATIPNLFGASMRARVLDYSGYGITTHAVLRISQRLEPFTWTLVSYGQEYPMVLGRGFHLNGADFVEQFDPGEETLRVPTPHVFIAVEKNPHRFQINNWAKRFDRAGVEERLQTWCTVYALTHRNIQVFLEDENVRIYEIVREEGSR
ncbi:MAG TPA: hypothetical protein VFV49_14090 [Thermoanaerobaculia bacterium]|nr:hypothetical protein [Thermoanaerobaculia bacterium]